MPLQTEFEIKFFIQSRAELIEKLIALWATQVYPERLMRRVNIDPVEGYTGKKRARIRDEWDKITCTFKSLADDTSTIDCVQEVECTISDFDTMIAIFQWLGVDYKNYQETRREKRHLYLGNKLVECCLDERPGIPPFIEIEWPDQAIVELVATQLWFSLKTWFFGSADLIYETLGICSARDVNHRKHLSFDTYPQ